MKNSCRTLAAVLLSAAVAVSSLLPAVPLQAERESVPLKEEETEEETDKETDKAREDLVPPADKIEESEESGTEEETASDSESEEPSEAEPKEREETEQEASGQNPEETKEETEEEPDTGTEPESGSEPGKEEEQTGTDPGDNKKPEESASQNKETEKEKNQSGDAFSQKRKEGADDGTEGDGKEIEEKPDTSVNQKENEIPEVIWNPDQAVPSGTYWDSVPYTASDFRFTQVDKVPVIAEGNVSGVAVYSSREDGQRIVGILPYFSVAYILEEEETDWLYIESGDVRGFVRSEDLADREYSGELVDAIGEEHFADGVMTCEKADNEAFLYTRTTVYDVVAEKEYALCAATGDIYEYPRKDSRPVGEAGSGTLAYILEETGDGWYFIESGDVRGFVPGDALLSGSLAEDIVNDVGEDRIQKATELIDPMENRSLYYTLKSVETAQTALGEAIAEYALSLVGVTEYVWGGTDLMLGADCSGFTQSVYAAFGVAIPRLAQDQGAAGELIDSLTEALPGDIIYYGSGPHVGIYVGNGQVVQCSGNSSNTAENPGKGATLSGADFMPITSIRRYLLTDSSRTGSCAADPTVYSESELELIWAIVAQEDAGSYEGALAVISSAMNRTESEKWSSFGDNALAQLTAPGQYCYSNDLNWIPRLNGNVPDYVKQAVSDCLTKGIRNHNYTSFRSYYTDGSVRIGGGNYYFS